MSIAGTAMKKHMAVFLWIMNFLAVLSQGYLAEGIMRVELILMR